jgi:hypothetical protein
VLLVGVGFVAARRSIAIAGLSRLQSTTVGCFHHCDLHPCQRLSTLVTGQLCRERLATGTMSEHHLALPGESTMFQRRNCGPGAHAACVPLEIRSGS